MTDHFKIKVFRALQYDILDYRYEARRYLSNLATDKDLQDELTVKIRDFLLPLATSGYEYYVKNYDIFQTDPSLKAATSICNTEQIMLDVKTEDKTVTNLAHLFNDLVGSSRNLYLCYDCGTNARAVWLKLIEERRGKLCLSDDEISRMYNEYHVDKDTAQTVKEMCNFLQSVEDDTAVICSIGLGESGHVFVIEVRIFENPDGTIRRRYHHYQSCLNSHTVLDFIEYKGYAENMEQSLDIKGFCRDLTTILTRKRDWNEKTRQLFSKLFAYIPYYPVKNPRNSIGWTYVTYSNVDSIKDCAKYNQQIMKRMKHIHDKQMGSR